jgi:hypothetical protein
VYIQIVWNLDRQANRKKSGKTRDLFVACKMATIDEKLLVLRRRLEKYYVIDAIKHLKIAFRLENTQTD